MCIRDRLNIKELMYHWTEFVIPLKDNVAYIKELKTLGSVSYTHLDVYKRQSQGHADASQFEIRIEPNKEARTLTISDTGIGLSLIHI